MSRYVSIRSSSYKEEKRGIRQFALALTIVSIRSSSYKEEKPSRIASA